MSDDSHPVDGAGNAAREEPPAFAGALKDPAPPANESAAPRPSPASDPAGTPEQSVPSQPPISWQQSAGSEQSIAPDQSVAPEQSPPRPADAMAQAGELAADAASEPPLLAPAPAGSADASPPAEPAEHPLVFHGRADQYFRIWIVNTLLTLLTFGVFFAWAKVRKRRYLRGSTELLGHRFDYRANPARLLIGHIVVLIFFLGYSLFGVVYPVIRFSVLGLAIVLLPWIVVRSFSFNAHNTVYRGLRFRFNRSLSAALKVYLLEPLAIPLTIGFYYPAWQRSKRKYAVSNHRFGDAYFHFEASAGGFYSAYLIAGLIFGSALFAALLVIGVWMKQHRVAQPTLVQLAPFFLVYGFGFFLGRQFIYAWLFNHVWNHTRVDDHRFCARLKVSKWLGLQLTNLGAIVVSAGLLYPWAVIRAQRYACSCLAFVPARSIDDIRRIGGSGGSATGDMAAEFIGIDFGL